MWCSGLWPQGQRRPVLQFGVQSAAVGMLFPAGSHSKRACAAASDVATGGARAHAGAWVPGCAGPGSTQVGSYPGCLGFGAPGPGGLPSPPQVPPGKYGQIILRRGSSGAGGGLGLSLGSSAGSFGPLPTVILEPFTGTACDLSILYLRPPHPSVMGRFCPLQTIPLGSSGMLLAALPIFGLKWSGQAPLCCWDE